MIAASSPDLDGGSASAVSAGSTGISPARDRTLLEDSRAEDARAPSQDPPHSPIGAGSFAIEVSGLTRRYGASRALDHLELRVPWDERLAVLGPNGAGKTTLLRILATLARPSSGRVFVGGLSLTDQAAAIRQHVGFVAHQTYLYDDLTVRENVEFYAKLYGVLRPRQRVDQILDLVGLRRRADTRVRALSRGLQQRAALARAIVHDPTILLLDEPDTGLDVDGVELVGRVMADGAGRRRTVILTTHNLERAVELTDRSVVLADGKVVYDRPTSASSVSALVAAIRGERGAA